MVPAMSGTGRIAIQPITLGTLPRQDEGSKALLFTQSWADPALAGGLTATYNLLGQYLSGQFTNIQAVWIDNSTNYVAVVFTSVETGQIIRVPGFAQGMYPIASNTAPIFTLTLAQSILTSRATTRFMLFNTPQRYFVNPGVPVFEGTGNVNLTIAVAASPIAAIAQSFGTNLYFRLKGFAISLAIQGAFAGNTFASIVMQQNGLEIWADYFNATPSSFGVCYTNQISFASPITPTSPNDGYSLQVSALPGVGGFYLVQLTYYYDVVLIQ